MVPTEILASSQMSVLTSLNKSKLDENLLVIGVLFMLVSISLSLQTCYARKYGYGGCLLYEQTIPIGVSVIWDSFNET